MAAELHLNNKELVGANVHETSGTTSPNDPKVFDDKVSNVPQRYRGTDSDKHDMMVLGKKQVLRVCTPPQLATGQMLILSSETSAS